MIRHPARRSSRIAALGSHQTNAAKRQRGDRGAAAVEFALVMPLLLLLVLGIAEFGRAYNIQTTISAAAREGVRASAMALQNGTPAVAAAKTSTKLAAAPAVALMDGQITVLPLCPAAGTNPSATTTVTVRYTMTFITDLFGMAPLPLIGTGVMRCNG